MELENKPSQEIPSNNQPIKGNKAWFIIKNLLLTLFVIGLIAIVPTYLINWVHPVENFGISIFAPSIADSLKSTSDIDVDKTISVLKKELNKNRTKLNAFIPKQPFIVISLTENHFWLYDANNKLVRDGVCSSGSYTTLSNGKKTWTFKTPKGVHKILSKQKDPVWVKPDWAFIEDGLPVPGPRSPLRLEPGVLGDYALHIGDGYMLHGTIYQRFLGLAVTHGCIRLGDEDLEVVFKTLVIGSKVFVY